MFKSVLGFLAIAATLVACADISDDLPEAAGAAGEAGAAGTAGSAGGSNVVPPGSGGSAGASTPSTGGSAGEAGSSNPVLPDAGAAGSAPSGDAGTVCAGEVCEFGHASACVQGESIYECTCLGIYLPQGVNISCDGDAGGSGGSTGGSGGAGGNSNPVLPDAGAAGTGGTTSMGGSGGTGGTVCAGAACVYGSAATCVQSGVTYTCSCLGIYPPQGSNVVCSDAGTGGSGGTGGSSGSGGAGGTSSTGGSGGSGGTAGSGGSGGNTATAGTMVVTVVAPTSGTHAYTVYAQTLNFMPGEPDWNSPKTVTGTRATVSYAAYAGSQFKLGGYYDPEAGQDPWKHQFCDPSSLKLTATVFATLDGKALLAPTVKSNGQQGCDIWLTATPLVAGTDDEDGDGYKAHASDASVKDCNDADASVHPGQVETPDDTVDMDCDSLSNAARVGYRIIVGQSSYTPVLYDWGHGGTQYSMTWNGSGYYEAFIAKPIAAADFVVQYGSSNWNVGWNYNQPGTCITFATVQVYLEGSNTMLSTSQVAIPQYTTCHTVVSGL